jgi:predicted nucleic acid-binding protein
MTLARRRRLTVCDAAYLELALRRGLPLATLDTALADAARAEGVSLVGHSTG